jgi:AraC-like DNA-binding protein
MTGPKSRRRPGSTGEDPDFRIRHPDVGLRPPRAVTLSGEVLDAWGDPPTRAGVQRVTRESVKIVRTPQLPGIEIQLIQNSQRKWTIYHSSFDFCCAIRTGDCIDWRYRNQTNCMVQRSMGLLVPGELHRVLKTPSATDYLLLLIEPTFIARFLEDDELQLMYSLCHQLDGWRHAALMGELWSAFSESSHDTLRVEGLVSEFLLSITEHTANRRNTSPPIHVGTKIVRDFLNDNHHRNVTLDECAKLAKTSKFHLHRSFVAELGVPPHQYLSGVRISRARDLLRGGVRPADVAGLTGFCDQSHLTRVFTEIVGLTPGAYASQSSAS